MSNKNQQSATSLAELAAQKNVSQEEKAPAEGASFPTPTPPADPASGGQEESKSEDNGQPAPAPVMTPPSAEVKAALSARGMNSNIIQIDESPFAKADAGASGKIMAGINTAEKIGFSAPSPKLDLAAGGPIGYPGDLSILGKSVLRQLDDYAVNMDPRKSGHETVINQNQVALFRSLITTINKLENDFQFVWTAILQRFVENPNKVFDIVNVYRGPQTIPLSATERATFFQLLNLISITASPKGRKEALRQVDPVATLGIGDVLTHAGRSKVMSFYNL